MNGGSFSIAAFSTILLCNCGIAAEPPVSFSEFGYSASAVELCEYRDGNCCDCGCCDVGCGDACCSSCGGGCTFDVDFLFLKYHQSGGVQSSDAGNVIGNNDNVEFDYSLSPRFTAAMESSNGFGARGIYWFYDDTAPTVDGAGFVSIDAYHVTAELFKRIQVTRSTMIEGFGGFRYSEFDQDDDTGLDYGFDGFGGTVGFELSHNIIANQRVYAGSRVAFVQGDNKLRNSGDLDDVTGIGLDHQTLQTELGIGWEGASFIGRGITVVYGAGAEFIQWSDAAVKNDSSDEAYLSDAGWGGFMFRLGTEY